MKCFSCGAALTDSDFCTGCGTDVAIYKKVIHISNTCYNDGLAKAKVRDLSGAAVSLRRSLKYDKRNIQARNLLGLVYFAQGEVVAALAEWIISKNIQGEKNIANTYIESVQSNQSKLNILNQTIKKYNVALSYCRQGSEDLAIIQLKKVLNVNPNLLKAQQLLGLLYMKAEDYSKAEVCLQRAAAIDAANTTTLKLLYEVNEKLDHPAGEAKVRKKEKTDQATMYTHGNETIIQPPVRKDHSGWSKVLHIAIGLLVGAAAMWFLVLPARIQLAKTEANDDIKKYSEQIAEKDEEINNLRSQVEASDSNIQQAQNEAANSVSSLENYRQVVALANSYLAEGSDVLEVFNSLGTIDQSVLPEDGLALYNAIYNQVSAEALTTLYEQGTKAWNRYNNEEAVQYLQQVVNMEVGYDDGNAVYYLGTSYERLGNIENALICANQVLEVVPAGTIRYNWAQNLINNNQAGDQE